MKHLPFILLAPLALGACATKPPECGDPAVSESLRAAVASAIAEVIGPAKAQASRELAENSRGAVVNGQYEEPVTLLAKATPAAIAARVQLTLGNIRTAAFDKDIGKYSCEADVEASIGETRQKLPVQYSVQFNAEKKLHVGLAPLPESALAPLAQQAVRTEVMALEDTVARAASLCKADESILFSCRAGTRTISVCATSDLSPTKGRLEYRAAREGRTEITLPADNRHPAQSVRAGNFMMGMGEGSYLRFSNAGTDYLPYSASGRFGDAQGITVEANGAPIAQLECDASSLNISRLDAQELQEKRGIPADTREFMP